MKSASSVATRIGNEWRSWLNALDGMEIMRPFHRVCNNTERSEWMR